MGNTGEEMCQILQKITELITTKNNYMRNQNRELNVIILIYFFTFWSRDVGR
jgi:hypothetical protein